MAIADISDQKPGIVTAFRVLLAFASVALILLIFLFANRNSATYDQERAARRYENLKKLREENVKKTSEFAVIDKEKGIYQLPINQAIALTARDLATIQPRAAYPVATPAPATPVDPAAVATPTAAPATATP